jgi:hypothetical protein
MNLPDAPIAHQGFFAAHFFTVSDQDKSQHRTGRRRRRKQGSAPASGKRRSAGLANCGCWSRPAVSRPTSDIWTTPPDPTSVHGKPLKSRQLPAFWTERHNLARGVHLQLPDVLRYA